MTSRDDPAAAEPRVQRDSSGLRADSVAAELDEQNSGAEEATAFLTRDGKHPFAMVPRELIENLRCAECARLYAYLDDRQGNKSDWAMRGIGQAATALSMQNRTIAKHLGHLEVAGIISIEGRTGRGWSKVVTSVIYNPSRGSKTRPTPVPEVWHPQREARWKSPPSPTAELEALAPRRTGDGGEVLHGAPRVEEEGRSAPGAKCVEGRDAPGVDVEARRAPPTGTTRSNAGSDAGRGAPGVPGSNEGLQQGLAFEPEHTRFEPPQAPAATAHSRLAEPVPDPETTPEHDLAGTSLPECIADRCSSPADGPNGYCDPCRPF